MAFKTIIVKGAANVIRKEGIAAEAGITPGDIVNAIPGGDVTRNDVTGATVVPRAIAVERDLTGDDIDTDYADNDTVLYAVCPPGTEVWMNGDAAITAGNYVEAAADGEVSPETTGHRIGRALTTTAGAARVLVELL
jgi:hypothetical protein